MPRLVKLSLALVAALGLSGCNRPPAPDQAPRPVASIQELMLNVVDPSADELWDSVSEHFTAAGSERHEPKTDADWAALRRHAIVLVEAPNLLVVKDRPVTVKSMKVADEGSPGIYTTAQIQKAIADDPARFAAAARRLQVTAEKMVAAIDRKDPAAVELVGSEIDEACEACHTQYWYPTPETRPPRR
jgi:hypothetical protein